MVTSWEDARFLTARRLFGARLRIVRQQAGLTQRKLAEAVGLEEKAISKMENANEAPRFNNLVLIASVLDVPMEEFFAFDTVGAHDKAHHRAIRDLLRLLKDQPAAVVETLTRQAKPLIALAGTASSDGASDRSQTRAGAAIPAASDDPEDPCVSVEGDSPVYPGLPGDA